MEERHFLLYGIISCERSMKKLNLLFVCGRNEQRSPTFETWFKNNMYQYDVKSAGISCYSHVMLTKELLEWADVVYVMDLKQEMFIARKFPEFLGKVIVVGCDDDYQRESSQLFKLIEYWVKKVNL
jgi:predicted protein tyrosine phosphatase